MKQKKKETSKKQNESSKKINDSKPKGSDIMAEVKYNPQRKSWMGPVTGNSETLMMTKLINDRGRQLQSQDAETLKHNRKKVQRTQSPNLEEDEETATIGEELNLHTAHIEKPFNYTLQDCKSAKWGAPVLSSDRSAGSADFEKPAKGDDSHFLSSTEKVKRLEQDIVKKDREMDLLRAQLEMAQRECYKLVEKLSGYTGKRYEDIAQENAQLKETVKLLNRKNTLLEGEKRKENNTKIKEMENARKLEEAHYPEWNRSTSSRSSKPQNQGVAKG